MSVVNREEIMAVFVNGDVVCKKCLEPFEEAEMVEEDIINLKDIEKNERIFFCDRCKKRL